VTEERFAEITRELPTLVQDDGACLLYAEELLVYATDLRAKLAEWEKHAGFLYAHGFFREPNQPVVQQFTVSS
jgi:hypothetical protein